MSLGVANLDESQFPHLGKEVNDIDLKGLVSGLYSKLLYKYKVLYILVNYRY